KAVLSRGVLLAIVGTTSGVVAGVFCARVLQSFIYGVKTSDPLTLVAVSTVIVLATLLACYLPARRASRIDPMAALREE
ncbi:MAG TPA: FtsX-like permease family protein, partial [Terriglobales bacterium]|nr:FtsX-like permease family protein [Terriglobales bacterium]